MNVHGDCQSEHTSAAKIGGVAQHRTARIKLGHERVLERALLGKLEVLLVSPRRHWKVVGESVARYIGVAAIVHRDPEPRVVVVAPDIGGVYERGAGRIQLRHEGVEEAATVSTLRGRRTGREVYGADVAGHISIALPIDCNGARYVIVAAAEVSRVGEHRIDDERPAA